jgi:hypothetical protein
MSTRYLPLLAAITTRLQQINPARQVTRSFRDFADRTPADLHAGIWTVQPSGVVAYPYEVSDGQFDSDSLRATEHGRLRLTVVGQLLLPQSATGEDVDAAEFGLIHELEQLADAAIDDAQTMSLLLKSVQMSEQAECPYAWVLSTWEVFSL